MVILMKFFFRNEIIRVIKRIDLWSKENGININGKKENICKVKSKLRMLKDIQY